MVNRQARSLGDEVNGAAIIADRENGEIVAYVGSSGYWQRDRSGAVNMAAAVRSPGSTLKPFVYGLAMDEHLIGSDTIVIDSPVSFAGYDPTNFDGRFRGDVTIADALRLSLNVPAVRVLREFGAMAFLERLAQAGTGLASRSEGGFSGLTAAVGGLPATLEELVHLYTALGANGMTMSLKLGADAKLFGAGRIISGRTAAILEDILRQNTSIGRVAAVKTGTSYGHRDVWALGVSEKHVIGVWFGRPDGQPMARHSGLSAAVPILRRLVRAVEPSLDRAFVDRFHRPPKTIANGGVSRAGGVRCARPITFPEDGARVPVGSLRGRMLPLQSDHRAGPLRWFVNSEPVKKTDRHGNAVWKIDGKGSVEIALTTRACGVVSVAAHLY